MSLNNLGKKQTIVLNRSDPIFRATRELPSIRRRRRTRDDIQLGKIYQLIS